MRREEDNSFPAGGPRPRPGFAIFRAIANAVRKPKEPWWSNKTDVIEKTSTTMDLLSLVTIDTLGITLGPECSGHHRRFVSALTLLTWQYLLTNRSCASLFASRYGLMRFSDNICDICNICLVPRMIS